MSRVKLKKELQRKGWLVCAFLFTCWEGFNVLYAQMGGSQAISEATSELKGWYDPFKKFIWIVAGLLGLVGAIKVYNKFNSADPESSKHAVAFVGSAVALYVGELFIRKMFIE